MEKSKIYLGEGKSVQNYDMVNFNLKLSKIPKDKILEYTDKEGNKIKFIRCTISKRRELDKYGNDYTVYLNEFVPEKKEEQSDMPF